LVLAPAAEAPYLVENVSAMTKMMIEHGYQARQGRCSTPDLVADDGCRTIRVPLKDWRRL